MASPRLKKEDTNVLDEFGFEFSEPPEKSGTRASKYDELFAKARALCMKYPGRTLKVLEMEKQSQPYNIAKAINNGEHRAFKGDDYRQWTAVARKITREGDGDEAEESYGLWLTYNGESEEE